MDYVNRLPALEDQPEYRQMCADRGTTPIERPANGLAYAKPGVLDDPALPFPLADLDSLAAEFIALRRIC